MQHSNIAIHVSIFDNVESCLDSGFIAEVAMEIFSVLVTGANRGIGLEFVRQLVHLEPPVKHIFATYRNSNGIQELEDIREKCPLATILHLIEMDVTIMEDIKSVKQMVENLVGDKGLTVLINNAGVCHSKPFSDITPENISAHLTANTIAPTMLTQVMYPLLKASAARTEGPQMSFSRAAILNMSSVVGSITNTGSFGALENVAFGYKISKAALNMAMRMIAQEARSDHILIVMMCPGWVKTDMGTQDGELEVDDSIRTMLSTIFKLNESHAGVYMDRYGEPYAF